MAVSDSMDVAQLSPFPTPQSLVVVIETPKGARSKLDYDQKLQTFRLKKTLPAGMTFPFDFGFIPQTKGEDGDPLDALVLMPESLPPGCIVEGRLIGVLLGEQTEKKKTIRNDRYLVVSTTAGEFSDLKHVDDLPVALLRQLEEFFVTYNRLEGRTFRLTGTKGPKGAEKRLRANWEEQNL